MNVAQAASSRTAAWPFIVAVAAFALYEFCLAPSVTTGGDSGELIAASYNLGVAHPSGYALYCLLAKAFATLLPFGEIAWRYNLFSAFCGAATAGVVTLLLQRYLLSNFILKAGATFHSQNLLPPVVSGLLLAGFVFFGAQSLIAEVYAPSGLAIALLLLCVAQWNEQQRFSTLCVLALGLGLGLNLHLSTIFLWPGLLVFFFLHYRSHSRNQHAQKTPFQRSTLMQLPVIAFCFLLGFGVTLYLPLRAATFPEPPRETIAGQEYSWWQPFDWGHPADFTRWKAHVSVQQYKSLLWRPVKLQLGGREFRLRTFAQSPDAALRRLGELLQFFSLQWLWCTPLVAIGAFAVWREKKQRPFAALLAMIFALNVFIAIHYRVDNVFDIANFLFPSYIVMAVWLGIGLAVLLEKTVICGSWSWRFSTLLKLAVIGAVCAQWILFANAASWRGNTRAFDDTILRANATEKLQREAGRRATLLFFSDDTLFPFWYAQHVLKRAPNTNTPYGPPLRAYEARNQLPQVAAHFLKTGPVATTQWYEELDAKFPYAPLTSSGNLWQLTTAALPPAAKVLSNPDEVLRDKPLQGKFLKTEVRRNELVGFQADFVLRNFAQRRSIKAEKQNVIQNGWLEVLVAPHSANLKPFPGQRDLQITSPRSALLAFKQTRRLIVSRNAHDGQTLRAIVPLQIPLEMAPGECDVWARIVASSSDEYTPWTPVQSVKLIVR